MAPKTCILGTGAYAPDRILTNGDLERLVDTSDAWITERTGIKERHIVSEGEKFSDLCTKAADIALKRSHVKPEELDMILVGTISGDMPFPATACLVQKNIGATRAAASDVGAACVGFLYGLHLADALIQSDKAANVLVIGGEILSRIVDWKDRSTCVLFGDGAGATLIKATKSDHGVLATTIRSDGEGACFINMPGGGSTFPPNRPETLEKRLPFIKMMGGETFKVAVRSMTDVSKDVLNESGFTSEDVNWLIPHQANERICTAVAERLAIPAERTLMNIARYGNTSAASIPIVLDEAVRAGKIKKGDLILFAAFGGGLTWGAGLVRW